MNSFIKAMDQPDHMIDMMIFCLWTFDWFLTLNKHKFLKYILL